MAAIEQELFEQIRRLDIEQKKQVLNFVHSLMRPRGEPVRDIIQHANQIGFSHEDLEEMRQFIEQEFERIDWDDWNNPPALST